MTIAAAMGGAFGVGLLLINTLVVILLWIKLRKKRSKPGSNETMQQEPHDGNSVIHVIIPSSQEIKQYIIISLWTDIMSMSACNSFMC